MTSDDLGDLDDLIAYPAERAAALAEISARALRYWDNKNLVRPGIRKAVGRKSVRLYTFEDMIALLVTAQLRSHGFSLQHVGRVVEHLRSRGYTEPLSQLEFATAGKEIYFRHPDGTWEGDLAPDQIVIRQVIDLALIRSLIRRGVRRPATHVGKVERHRGRLGRKPVFAGSRIPVDTVTRMLADGSSPAQILNAYPDLGQGDIDLARRTMVSA